MELSLGAQAIALLYFFFGGIALGLIYDLLRPIRRRGSDWAPDILFCLAAAILFFILAMGAGNGQFGTWELMSALLAFCLYINLFSPLVLPCFEMADRILANIMMSFQNQISKCRDIAKKFFQKLRE